MRVPVPTSRTVRSVNLSFQDVAWALACPILALYLRDAEIVSRAEWSVVGAYWILASGFSLLGFLIFRIHDEIAHYFSVHGMLDIAKAIVFAELASCIVLFLLTRLNGIPRSTPLIHGLLLAAGLIAIRMFVRIECSEDNSVRGHIQYGRIILIGANRFSSFFIKLLNAYTPDQQRIIAVLDERASTIGRAISGVRVLGTPRHLESIIDEFVVHGIRTEQVIIAGEADLLCQESMNEVLRVCGERQIELTFLPRMIGVSALKRTNPAMACYAASEKRTFPLPPFFWMKRWFDIFGSLLLIVLLLPLFMAVALLVYLDVGSPILFWQRRLGRNGHSFHIYKFRTLRAPFDSCGNPIPESSRLANIGRFLRVTRVDELPQLLNVLNGDMSLIGPRPLLPEDQPSTDSIRLMVRPGITGWAQIHGGKLVSPEEKERLDEWYIRNMSLLLDLRIIFMTLKILAKSTETSAEALADAQQAQSKNVPTLRTVKAPAISSPPAEGLAAAEQAQSRNPRALPNVNAPAISSVGQNDSI